MKRIPKALRGHEQFCRYFDIWRRNQRSIVFVPLAEMLQTKELLAEACQVCEAGLQYNAESISGRVLLASVYSALGRQRDAERLAHEILKRMPAHSQALKYLFGTQAVPQRSSEVVTAAPKKAKSKSSAKKSEKELKKKIEKNTEKKAKKKIEEKTEKISAKEVVDSADTIDTGIPLSIDALWQTPTMANILANQGEIEEAARIFDGLIQRSPKNRQLRSRMKELQDVLTEEEKTVV